MDGFSNVLDVSVVVSLIVTSPVVLIVLDITDSVACVDIVVVRSVVIGASQSIRKTCAGLVELSVYCNAEKIYKRLYWNKSVKIPNR
jgi:hypothetical protein